MASFAHQVGVIAVVLFMISNAFGIGIAMASSTQNPLQPVGSQSNDNQSATTNIRNPDMINKFRGSTETSPATASGSHIVLGGLFSSYFQQSGSLPNTLTIISTSNERSYYNATTSGRFGVGDQADLTNADQPDTVTNTTASGSSAERGVDTFVFSGQITSLALNGGSARVLINGREVNPATIPETTAPTGDTTAYLAIPPNERETAEYRQATLDVSGVLALDTGGLQGRFNQSLLDERFANIDAISGRRTSLERTATHIETRTDALRARQATAISQYNTEILSRHEFLRELTLIDMKAGQLTNAVDRVEARARGVPGLSVNGQPVVSWALNRRLELSPFQGPVRDRIREAFQGNNTVEAGSTVPSGVTNIASGQNLSRQQSQPLSVYVVTSPTGVNLATVDDGQYSRETALLDGRNGTGSGLDSQTAVLDRLRTLYPWAVNHSGSTELSGDAEGRYTQVRLFHSHGRLTTFLNQSSGRVVAEHQQQMLVSVPTSKPVTATHNGLRVTVNRTQPTGPLEVSLSKPNGRPVDGSVTINRRVTARTGRDGRVWMITPHGTMTIVARANGEVVRFRLPPQPRVTSST